MNFGKIKDLKVGDWVEIPFHLGHWPSAERRKPRPGEQYYQVVVVGSLSAQVETERSSNYSITDEIGNYPFIVVDGPGLATQEPPILKLPFNYSLNRHCWTSHLEVSMIQKAADEAASYVRRTRREWPYNHVLTHEVDKTRDEIRFFLKKESAKTKGQ